MPKWVKTGKNGYVPACSFPPQILELVKTRSEITVKEIEESTGTNRNTIKVHVKKPSEQQYLRQVGQGRGARYMIK